MPSDKEYQQTRQVMLGKRSLRPEFRKLANWIDMTFGVRTINIISDTIDNGQRPRLQICFEFEKEVSKFLDRRTGVFDRGQQLRIAEKFREVISGGNAAKTMAQSPKYMTDNVWVIFSAFEPVARIEAHDNIPESKFKKLKTDLDNDDLWEISRRYGGATFFLFTDFQVQKYDKSPVKQEWTDRYFDLLAQYNEFGYFKRKDFSIYLDSKQNFDENYESNWYYYYK